MLAVLPTHEVRHLWVEALRQRGDLRPYDEYWEYKEAYAELRVSEPRLLERPEDLVLELRDEAHEYSVVVNRVVETNVVIRKADQALRHAASVLTGLSKQYRLGYSLRTKAVELLQMCSNLRAERGLYWKEASVPRSGASLSQERQADTLFQVRVARILRKYAPNVSLMTISRLVLLTYICTKLAEEREIPMQRRGKTGPEAHLVVLQSNPPRKLTIPATYEKLRDARMH